MSEREVAFAKLNLALHVRSRRPDGYHDIETLFAFCEDGDVVTARPAAELELNVTGPFAAALSGPFNLVMQAALRFQQATPGAPGAAIHLEKLLPVASGLGGGSADAAATLRLLERQWGHGAGKADLNSIAHKLGADVPACLLSEPARGDGRGDQLERVELGMSGTPVLLVNPRVELSTAEVFARWDGIDRGPLDEWRSGRNDLEESAVKIAPQIRAIVAWLSAQPGANFVRMSGSGATCFAFFETDVERDRAADAVPREWWRLATRLR